MNILFGVFDWGLGHATRDISLIEELLKRKNSVDIISTGRALSLLKNRFGEKCTYFDVSSLYIPFSATKFFFPKFILAIPRILYDLKVSRNKTEKIIESGNYDKIISDCRYDVYDKKENSYFIHHHISLKMFPLFQYFYEYFLFSVINKYGYLLIPDFDKNDISGDLSHNLKNVPKSRVVYIGIISQLKKLNIKKDIDYFISISGPEPQRTEFEKKVIPQLKNLDGKIVVALGKPESDSHKSTEKIQFYSFLNQKKQEEMMNRAKFIISRPGYTTMMEFCELGVKKALIIPTPGQPEQEYLADLYEERGLFHHMHQDQLNLKEDLNKTNNFNGFKAPWKTTESVKKFIKTVFK
jgi:hypothetical protein